MKPGTRLIGRNVWKSEEFRAFAIKWLGFDPRDEDGPMRGNRCIEIRIAPDEVVSYKADNMGTGPGEVTDFQALYAERDATKYCSSPGSSTP